MMSQTAEYALLAVITLADQHPNPQPVGRVAAATNVPAGYLSKVLQKLARGRIVEARRGTRGGFVLAREPNEITALDVINAVSPLKGSGDFPASHNSPDFSPLKGLIDSAHDYAVKSMRESSIASLIKPRAQAKR